MSEDRPDVATRFKVGNSSWRARSSHGRNPAFATPEALQDACYEYLQWVEDNPIMTAETVKFQGHGELMEVPKMRAPTIKGMCTFLDITPTTYFDYAKKPDFSDTCERIEAAMYSMKIEGAAADLLNAGIIGKELGLTEKVETKLTGSLAATTREMTLEEASRVYEDNLKSSRE